MELTKNFEPGLSEEKWYRHWMDKGYFHSTPDHREPYTIVMPPPNVTGVLHMGHCLNNTIQDILIRRARMEGKNACWVPGTDHASIATEAKVVAMLRERGISKSSLSRDEFLAYAWEWKEKYGGIILQQLRKLGCSPDWNRTSFTMDPHYYASVVRVFVDLYRKGLIYRGKRMIHWDVKALTALSDEEVIRREVRQKLYHVKYRIDGSDDHITIATVRPETIMGDTAVCVHPEDERYLHLHGRSVIVPLVNRKVRVITDDYVSREFGTGVLKVTPAHDMNDYALGQKHQLEVIDVFNDDGTLSEAATIFVGLERFEARKQVVAELEKQGLLLHTEEYTSEVGFSERTDVVVEPRLSLQWWVRMKEITEPALDVVMKDDIQFHPGKFKNLYRHWMENIKDWCISRQLWWGHRIPAWYDEEGRVVVSENEAGAQEAYQQAYGKSATLRQDEDCLDTWFSSWLWPFEVFNGISDPDNREVSYYYPTQTLVTAPDIIFFWVARMIMAGLEYQKAIPFSQVYFTGTVRDKQGRKMSKSLGNSPDLLGLIDQYGADATRFGIMIASPAGNDILFDEAALDQGRLFNNKMWNALKLLHMWRDRGLIQRHGEEPFAVRWFRSRLSEAVTDVRQQMEQFRLSEALKTLYSLIWDDFCSWYLEWIKPGMNEPMDAQVYQQTVSFYTELMHLLHPFMPFVTEEIYQHLEQQTVDLCVRTYTPLPAPDAQTLHTGQHLKQVISGIRDLRNKQNIRPKDSITLYLQTESETMYRETESLLNKQVNAASLTFTREKVADTITTVIGKDTFYVFSEKPVDTDKQKSELEKELEHLRKFLSSVEAKLNNPKFRENARADVLAMEQKKQADAQAKIAIVEQSLAALN